MYELSPFCGIVTNCNRLAEIFGKPEFFTKFLFILNLLTQVTNNDTLSKKYTYDGLGRLVREDNRDLNKTFVFTYDNAGNITSRKEYVFTVASVNDETPTKTVSYSYQRNQLLSYDDEDCSYNVLGNPNTYRDKTAVWTKVHRLASYNGITFEYDYAGIRTKKTVNGITIKYGINGSTIVSEQKGTDATSRITYYYGFDGVTAFKYGGQYYYYQKNAFGDIIGIFDNNDDLVAKYVYDAWGNHKVLNPNNTENTSATFIGNINPFRYRSYYFDTETGFYYLQSRYYDPEVGRFISMDSIEYLAPETINGLNLFAYCLNDPVNKSDPTGTVPVVALIICAVLVVGAVAATALIVAAVTVTGGLASAVLLGAGVGALCAVSNSIESQGGLQNLENIDPWKVAASGVIGSAVGAASGAFSYGVSQVVSVVGAGFGQMLSNSYFQGVKIGTVFSPKLIEDGSKLTGYALGMFGANTFFDYSLNKVTNNDEDSDSFWSDVLETSGASFIIDFFRLFK